MNLLKQLELKKNEMLNRVYTGVDELNDLHVLDVRLNEYGVLMLEVYVLDNDIFNEEGRDYYDALGVSVNERPIGLRFTFRPSTRDVDMNYMMLLGRMNKLTNVGEENVIGSFYDQRGIDRIKVMIEEEVLDTLEWEMA